MNLWEENILKNIDKKAVENLAVSDILSNTQLPYLPDYYIMRAKHRKSFFNTIYFLNSNCRNLLKIFVFCILPVDAYRLKLFIHAALSKHSAASHFSYLLTKLKYQNYGN
jgi:hypothetical protein